MLKILSVPNADIETYTVNTTENDEPIPIIGFALPDNDTDIPIATAIPYHYDLSSTPHTTSPLSSLFNSGLIYTTSGDIAAISPTQNRLVKTWLSSLHNEVAYSSNIVQKINTLSLICNHLRALDPGSRVILSTSSFPDIQSLRTRLIKFSTLLLDSTLCVKLVPVGRPLYDDRSRLLASLKPERETSSEFLKTCFPQLEQNRSGILYAVQRRVTHIQLPEPIYSHSTEIDGSLFEKNART